MTTLKPLLREEAMDSLHGTFDRIKSKYGMVPNMYAVIANSKAALPAFLDFEEGLAKGRFSGKEVQAIYLVVSQVNGCRYCQSAHTVGAKMYGFTDEDAIDLRSAKIEDKKLNALITLAAEITRSHGRPSYRAIENFYFAGYDNENLIELIAHIGYKTVANYMHNIFDFPIDFPRVKELEPLVV